jgi:DNA-binding NtrC family response regulator
VNRRILVVDDDRLMVRTLSDILRLRGWETHAAYSGEEAIERVRAGSYLAVLMDVRMGGMNGVEAMKVLHAIRPATRVILMTAYTAAELLAEAEREGALQVLAKPVAIPSLIEMLEQAVAGARRVLVVDDDREFLRSLRDVLGSHGFAVLEAADLGTALEQLEERHPAAVVLDLRLPDVAPQESVVAVKRASPAVVLILCSGSADVIDATAAAVPGSWIYASLRKPFPPEHLVGMLDELVVA